MVLNTSSVFCEASPQSCLLDGIPFKRSRPLFPRTAFSTEVKTVKCWDGFRCASKVSRFGFDHVGDVNPAAAASVDPGVNEYEWNCPGEDRTWKAGEYVVGPDEAHCSMLHPDDCLCISRGSANSRTTMQQGKERVFGWFDVQPPEHTAPTEDGKPSNPDPISQKELEIVPHYKIRLFNPGLNIDNIYSSLGGNDSSDTVELTAKAWLEKYNVMAPKMQAALDRLKTQLDEQFKEKVMDKSFICGEADMPDEHPALTRSDSQAAASKIRRFQMLSAECAGMRDTAAKLSPTAEDERFFPGQSGKKLNCFLVPGTKTCQQLNCYRGMDDQLFRSHLREFKQKLLQCRPEKDVPSIQTTEAGIGMDDPLRSRQAGFASNGSDANDPALVAALLRPSCGKTQSRRQRQRHSDACFRQVWHPTSLREFI